MTEYDEAPGFECRRTLGPEGFRPSTACLVIGRCFNGVGPSERSTADPERPFCTKAEPPDMPNVPVWYEESITPYYFEFDFSVMDCKGSKYSKFYLRLLGGIAALDPGGKTMEIDAENAKVMREWTMDVSPEHADKLIWPNSRIESLIPVPDLQPGFWYWVQCAVENSVDRTDRTQ